MVISIIPTANWDAVGESCLADGTDVATLACVPIVLQNIINTMIFLAGVIAVFFLIYAGYKFVMSEGDPEKVATARRTATYAIAGLVFIILSFVVMGFIGKFTGVDQIVPK